MKKRIITTLLLLIAVSAVGFAKDKNYYRENRSVGSFDAVSVCCGIDLYITDGRTSSNIVVETNYKEYLSRIETEVKKGELKISFNNNGLSKRPNNMRIKVSVTATNLTAIRASSGADVDSSNALSAQDIKLAASSGADIKIELNAQNIECSSSSGSDIKLTGSAAFARVKASSGSDIDMRGMTVRIAEASASSGSDIDLYVTEELNASASSGADIKFRGNPKNVKQKKSGGGSVKAIK